MGRDVSHVVAIDAGAPDEATLARAAAILRRGGLVAFPTETVYGLGANAVDPAAVAQLYEAKGRPAKNPLIVHVADSPHARRIVDAWPSHAEALAERFWPGPLTLVLPRPPHIPDIVTAGLDTVAIRAPNHPVAQRLIEVSGLPLAAPSANRSGMISPTQAEHVAKSLGERVELILDAGPTAIGIESTVVGLSPPRLLRRGHIRRDEVEAVVGPVLDLTKPASEGSDPDAPPSPGMMLRHYAPEAEVVVVAAGDTAALATAMTPGTGALLRTLTHDGDHVEILPDDPAGFAQGLYAAMHRLDACCSRLVIEAVPEDDGWAAVRDRIERAARPR
ncbi:MAG TPA: threonylcarbamoyl-AMP synthase [Polyangiaceae bacterium]|nr:threonylcarbamoyl-AMP synthase [Polyangiaceae bacterium]